MVRKKVTRNWLLSIAAIAVVTVLAGVAVWAQPNDSDESDQTGSATAVGTDLNPIPEADRPMQVSRPQPGKLGVLFVGDSVTSGLYASRFGLSFKSILTRKIYSGGDADIVSASEGDSSSVNPPRMPTRLPDLSLAIVEIGTVDVFESVQVEVFSRNYASLLDSIAARSPNVRFICLGLWRDPATARPYNYEINRLCAARKGRYRALGDLFLNASLRGPAGKPMYGGVSDNFYPNDEGHEQIADRVLGAFNLS